MNKEQIKNIVIETIQNLIDDSGLLLLGDEPIINLTKYNNGYDISDDFILDIEEKLSVKVFHKDWANVGTINDSVELLTKYVECREKISKNVMNVLSKLLGDIELNENLHFKEISFRSFELIAEVQVIDDEIWKKCKSISDVINLLTQVSCSNFEEARKKQKYLYFFIYNQLR